MLRLRHESSQCSVITSLERSMSAPTNQGSFPGAGGEQETQQGVKIPKAELRCEEGAL